MTKRATCSRSNSPNGRIGLCGSVNPGRWFMRARSFLRSASRPRASGASTRKLACGVTVRGGLERPLAPDASPRARGWYDELGCAPAAADQNCKAKSMSRFLSQYTLPRYRPGPTLRISSRILCASSDV